MKKVFKTLSAILLASACLMPGLAWAAGPSVTLNSNGTLTAADMNGVHSILVEVAFSGPNAEKVTDVELKSAPSDALASAVYANGKATVAVSAGNDVLQLANSSLGKLEVIAQDASEANPVQVKASVKAVEYLDTEDSSADVQAASVNASNSVTLTSTKGTPSNGTNDTDGINDPDGFGGGSNGGVRDGSNRMNGSDDPSGLNGSNGNTTTTTADYRANGVVTQAGQGADANLVRTGDVLLICGIALGAAVIGVAIAMIIARKKGTARK